MKEFFSVHMLIFSLLCIFYSLLIIFVSATALWIWDFDYGQAGAYSGADGGRHGGQAIQEFPDSPTRDGGGFWLWLSLFRSSTLFNTPISVSSGLVRFWRGGGKCGHGDMKRTLLRHYPGSIAQLRCWRGSREILTFWETCGKHTHSV